MRWLKTLYLWPATVGFVALTVFLFLYTFEAWQRQSRYQFAAGQMVTGPADTGLFDEVSFQPCAPEAYDNCVSYQELMAPEVSVWSAVSFSLGVLFGYFYLARTVYLCLRWLLEPLADDFIDPIIGPDSPQPGSAEAKEKSYHEAA